MNVFTASVVEKCVGILSNSISVDFFSPYILRSDQVFTR